MNEKGIVKKLEGIVKLCNLFNYPFICKNTESENYKAQLLTIRKELEKLIKEI